MVLVDAESGKSYIQRFQRLEKTIDRKYDVK